jgi:hypothetical protein
MANSIYHFFVDLCQKKGEFTSQNPLDTFPFDKEMLSCINEGKFPDLAIKLNHSDSIFSGGELIELKDSKIYSVASFNSTIPTGEKDVQKLIEGGENIIRTRMQEAGDDILSLPIRQVFYLIRGRNAPNVKVCLAHGKFFETIPVPTLISESFGQALEERLNELGTSLSPSLKQKLLDLFSEQETFSRTRNIENASVRLRFRVMTEVKAGGNILNQNQYPQIDDNTLNFAAPCHTEEEQKLHIDRMKVAFERRNVSNLFSQIEIFTVQHHFNGPFLIFQTNLLTA